MTPTRTRPLTSRHLGDVRGARSGPTVVLTAGIHGNEPAGLAAARRALETLEHLPFRGRVVALAGNVAALNEDRRFLVRDLNRGWDTESVRRVLAAAPEELQGEDREQRELLQALVPLLREAEAPITFLDLHSTSGPGAPFCCMADVLRNRRIAFALGIPTVLGLEEVVEGAMLGWLCELGHVGVAVEGGAHGEPSTVDHHEAAIWCTWVAAGIVDAADVPDLARHRERLREISRGLPSVVEIRRRHLVHEGDEFQMQPGYRNFQPVVAEQVVASDTEGDVLAGTDGLMMLPRYQGEGEDGFFIARPTKRAWLQVSAALRRLRLEGLITAAPGVRRDPDRAGAFVVDPRIARWRTTDLFHLFGYRRARPRHDGALVYSRRRPDRAGIERPTLDALPD